MKIEADAGYIVRTGEPVCIAEVTASSTSVSVPSDPIADGEYLISLEVNGTVVAHRDTFTFASGSCTVGDYTVAYASNSVTVSTTDEDDVVRLMIEPVKAIVTDEFKTAVAKVAPKGNGGGGIEVVRFDYDGEEWSADKTYQELIAANTAGKTIIGIEDLDNSSVACGVVSVNEIYFTFFYDAKGTVSMKQLYYASDGTITANV